MGCAVATAKEHALENVQVLQLGRSNSRSSEGKASPRVEEFQNSLHNTLENLTLLQDDVRSSWNVAPMRSSNIPKGGVAVQPDRRLHESHVQRIDSFLKQVEASPRILTMMVDRRRKKDHSQSQETNSRRQSAEPLPRRKGHRMIVQV
ncbi:unnamed protein product [Symbiodinium sp. CCMP2592]|nr:unnamed protein product [Symbiodinium sp. CCMP2592]